MTTHQHTVANRLVSLEWKVAQVFAKTAVYFKDLK